MPPRPVALRRIVGHTGAVRLFARLVDRGRLPHALILDGPPGCGRRTLGRALAGALLCPQRMDGDACGVCAHCAQTAAGTHPDLTELPGRREFPAGLPVEQARTVAEAAGSSPLLGVAKAIIVPDAELLRGASANALLKVLEEPPPATTIILTAQSAASVLGTIRSRAQVYRLQALTAAEAERLAFGLGGDAAEAAAPPPHASIERVLAGLDLGAIAEVVAALPAGAGDEEPGDGAVLTPAARQRACLRTWLIAHRDRLRPELASAEPACAARALDRLDRLGQALGDLDRNFAPRQVLEALALGR